MGLLETIVKTVFGDPNDRKIKICQSAIDKINALESDLKNLTDGQLKGKTLEFRARLSEGEVLDDLLPEAFAVVREASVRTLKMRHFDVQLIGGIVLHQGKISEMKTGEGKTLVSTLPAYLNALEGHGVYIVTVNDYLAKRDHGWMGTIFNFLGLSVGLIQSGMNPEDRLRAYECDITYGTNNEFGFDYLRDNLATDPRQCCQVRRHYAIVDEVDSILIDEARTPLIISGPIQDSTSQFYKIARLAKCLQKDGHFTLDEKHKNVVMTEAGIEKAEKELGMDDLYSLKNMDTAHMMTQCLRAVYLFKRDVDYVIKDGEVIIVDEFTGRLLEGRRYSDGLHQAIEAVENLKIKEESQTLATVTFQNYFRMFPKLAGMTGTAVTEADEFLKIYGLEVISIPTHQKMIRDDMSDIIFKSKEEKYKVIVKEIKAVYEKGQPILVGTIAIETSELISSMLRRDGIPHSVLNAKYHEREAEIIAKAGQKKTVTIATNMAGRGTDIVLGEGVRELGGLYVLGTSRHESRRIDNQLRGRSGRQGDSGCSRFYISLEDDLMRLFGSDRIAKVMDTLGVPADTPIEHPLISKSIERAQRKVEQYYFGIRKQVLQFDDVMNRQRTTIYALRDHVLEKNELNKKIEELIADVVKNMVNQIFAEDLIKENDSRFNELEKQLQVIFPISHIAAAVQTIKQREKVIQELVSRFYEFYLMRTRMFPEGIFEEITKEILLRTIDRKWMDHLHNIEVLRDGIGLRAWGQRDPLMEYKIEGFEMFAEMLGSIATESMEILNRIHIVNGDETEKKKSDVKSQQLDDNKSQEMVSVRKKKSDQHNIGRNDPCPCGSGKKYKKCCMN